MRNLAIILAAGRGKRLSPLTDLTPKPLLEHNGKRYLEYSLDAVDEAEIMEVCVVIGYLGTQISDFFARRRNRVNPRFVEQPNLTGSADALSTALDDILQDGTRFGMVAVLASDYVMPKRLISEMMIKLKESGADGAVLVMPGGRAEAQRGSIVEWGNGDLIRHIEEKPTRSLKGIEYDTAKLAYIFCQQTLDGVRKKTTGIQGREESIPDRVNSLIQQGAKFVGFRCARFPDADSIVL